MSTRWSEFGRPLPLGPDALAVAGRRGEGETAAQHDQDGADQHDAVHLMPELKAQQLELGTPVCSTLAEVEAELRFWRGRAGAAAAAVGAQVAALATAPVPVEPAATEGGRYARMIDVFGPTAQEMLTCGCHVHVSVADDEEGVAVLKRIRIWLPVLTGLTANLPFWQGRGRRRRPPRRGRGHAGRSRPRPRRDSRPRRGPARRRPPCRHSS